ncbi:MAG: ATP-binding protein [Anaerolineae bacterium]|nr:MAG: ATP-binding protein [Anaerolineae bacterium]
MAADLKSLLKEPQTIEELHIPQNIIIDLALRLLFNEGNVALSRMVQVIRVNSQILDKLMLWMQKEHLVEVSQAGTGLGRLGYVYTLTEAGEERARDALERSQYVGPAPVPIHYYNQAIELQTQTAQHVRPEQVQHALRHLILPSDFHRRVGPAVNSGTSLFLYGPPGNGKTTIAQAIARLIAGTEPIWLPYALTAGGHIIQVYDRLIHERINIEGGRTAQLGRTDRRWGLFKRPSVMVGGELKMDALDLRYDPIAKFYEAPLQLKANGGMFLIDDFGRQQISPTDLLNRWIVPLESKVDFLRMRNGQTIVVPFRQLIVFSTNLDPNDLVDDAFLRRIHIKVKVEGPDQRRFFQIFVVMCKQMGVPFDKQAFLHLLQEWYIKPKRVMQAVHPRDILKTLTAICAYEGTQPRMTPQLIDEACRNYFVD